VADYYHGDGDAEVDDYFFYGAGSALHTDEVA